jgi:hypothetical protein
MGNRASYLQLSLHNRVFSTWKRMSLLKGATMNRRAPDHKKQPLPSASRLPHLEAHDEAENFDLGHDRQAWGKLAAFHERFVLLPWDNPASERDEDIDNGHGRQFPKRG